MKFSVGDRLLHAVFWAALTAFTLFCLAPFLLVLTSSFTDEITLIREGYSLFPKKLSAEAYRVIFSTPTIYKAYGVTIFATAAGTLCSMAVTASMAFGLSRPHVKYRNVINFLAYFTMLFGGGLVPTYILISRALNLKDSLWVYVVPFLLNPYNMFLLRNFFSSLPKEIFESATIDGANDASAFFKIALPLAKPALATVSLFYALSFWNDWFTSVLYIDNADLQSLQYLIMKLVRNISESAQFTRYVGGAAYAPSYGMQLATAIVSVGPIVLLYPFLQRYFIKGITLGSIKG
jgi:multiple sugar transport system permease protein/putative aldouronate transport system permease protein